ncbi:MAG: hypothetical protein WA792_07515 [Pseudolabrys sp.]
MPAQKLVPSPSLVPPRLVPTSLVPESQRCRVRARECRALASRLRVDFAREHLLKAADGFERSARDAQEREIGHGISQLGELVRGLHRTK